MATALFEAEARAFRVSADESATLAAILDRLAAGHGARPGLAMAIGAGWSRDPRLDAFLQRVPANTEPQVHRDLLRVLDHRPSPAYSEYVLRLLLHERDHDVLRSALDADRIAAATTHVPARRVFDAVESRLAEGRTDVRTRRRYGRAIAVAGLADRDGGASLLERMSAAETDTALAAKLSSAADMLRRGVGTPNELEDLLD